MDRKFGFKQRNKAMDERSYLLDERTLLYRSLTDLGDFYQTSLQIDLNKFYGELEKVSDTAWVYYNPRKPGYKRWGISLTSLDGGLSGVPDLDSIWEYNSQNGTHWDEMSFKQITPMWHHFTSISSVLDIFCPYMGRSHLLKLGLCGSFPPHRDLGSAFRLISCLTGSREDFYLSVKDQRRYFERGYLYFLNTRLEHFVFSFNERSVLLVLNLAITPKSVGLVYNNLSIK